MFEIKTLLILIPGLPLLACLLTAFLGAKVLRRRSHWPTVLAIVASFVCSLFLLSAVHRLQAEQSPGAVGIEQVYTLWSWVDFSDAYQLGKEGSRAFSIEIALRADPLTAIMLTMVTCVSSLVAIYSIGYMHDDRGYWRFFTYVSLFVFSMTMLVSASNFLLLYVFWEAVGFCSYILIGFWYEKPTAAAAGKKAFLVTRCGDFGFALGVFLIWTTYGTLNFHDVNADGAPAAAGEQAAVEGVLGQSRLARPPAEGYIGGPVGIAIVLCLLAGACGKSAQFPLHVWLPDAMEGPTPVSALIHAATMVTAGVYMFTRVTPLLVAAPDGAAVVAIVGSFTALLAALIALTQNDLKRIMAYSTISQLGYMFLGVGVSTLAGITAGMFHLFTHAFFKALLFLASGSVMHAMGGVIDITRFGGLRRVMPWTCRTFLFGALALCGVFPFAGFWSKDAILASAHEAEHGWMLFGGTVPLYDVLYYLGLFTAFLTAIYTFRAFFKTFYGATEIPQEAGHHAHESPRTMIVPLQMLALAALVVGAVEYGDAFGSFLSHTPSLAYAPLHPPEHTAESGAHAQAMALSTL
ncbi:MAG TPA: NADH-quinone oxidoreductase subunit L, partial [Pirellulales bacterium]